MSLRHLQRNEIDASQWDDMISRAPNGLIYARTALLDAMAPGWEALVWGDYQAVMPLTLNSKFGIRYLYQPPFLQQLGVFGNADETLLRTFTEEAMNRFRFAEIFTHMPLHGTLEGSRSNYVIDLGRSYADTCAGYSGLHRKNLQRAEGSGLYYVPSKNARACIELSYSLYHHKTPHVGKQAYEALASFAEQYPQHMLVREVRKENALLASAFCLLDQRRIYFVINNVPQEGRKAQANHWLVDQLIREFSGPGKLLDFEGSDIPGIAEFYKGFGAENRPYYFHKWNRLPWPLRLIKR